MFLEKKKYGFALIASFIIFCVSYGQNTYSRVYDLGVGNDNRAQYFFVENDAFVVASTHSGDTSVVSAFTRFDFEGNILDQNSYADYVFGRSKTVVQTENGFDTAGHIWGLDNNQARGLELVKLNNNLDFVDRILVDYEVNRSTNNPSIIDIDAESKVVYGSFINKSNTADAGVYLGLLEQETDSLLAEVIFRSGGGNVYGEYRVSELQKTLDGNMLFIVEVDLPGAGPSSGSHFEIVKFNWTGEVLKKVVSDDDGPNQAIAQDDEGDIYFYNARTPFYLDTVDFFGSNRAGGIVKLNADMDTVMWSFNFRENDMISDLRGHGVFGIRQLSDDNLLVWGITGYATVDNQENIGFVGKFTKEGEVLWTREYGIPIPEEYISLSNYRELGNSIIDECEELDDGRILCIGENAYSKPDISFFRELWVLMLDENGCIDSNCNPSNILTSTPTVETFDEGTIYPNPVTDILYIFDVYFDTYKIYDLMGRLIQQGTFTDEIHLRQEMNSGMYVLQLKEDFKLKSVFRFIRN